MKRRIILWATTGFVVGGAWVVYAFLTAPDVDARLGVADRLIQALAYATCPIIIAGMPYYWVLPANTITYAPVGLLWESIRRNSK